MVPVRAPSVMLGASYTLFRNEHVRVDIVYGNLGARTRLWVDIFGIIFFLLPAMLLLAWMTWPFFVDSLRPATRAARMPAGCCAGR